MGLGAMSPGKTQRYVERVQQLFRGDMIEWDFEDQQRKIQYLDPALGLINVEDAVPLWVSVFGPKAKATTAALGAGWLNFDSMGALQSLQEMQAIRTAANNPLERLSANLFFLSCVLSGDKTTGEARLLAQAGPLTAVTFHNMANEVGVMGGGQLNHGPLKELMAEYMKAHDQREPADILRCAPLTVRATKEVAMRGLDLPLPKAYQTTYKTETLRRASADTQEGPRA